MAKRLLQSGNCATRSKATIDDVAAAAGVSIKTVSRVVNREPNVGANTRAKIESAIRELDYHPNPAARGLAANRSHLIGLLYDNPSDSYVTQVQSGALSACADSGYNLLIQPCNQRSTALFDGLDEFLRRSHVDGVILTPPLSDLPEPARLFERHKLPYVRIAPRFPDAGSSCVYCDDRQAAFDLASHLIALGHRRIGFIAGPPDHGASSERRAGFEAALSQRGIRTAAQLIAQGNFDFNSGLTCGTQLLGLSNPPTAIFCSNDEMALGALYVAHEKGRRIPEDLSITGFDDTPMAARTWPSLTTVQQPVQAMAQLATQYLLSQLKATTQHGSPSATQLRCRILVRQTSAPPRR